MTYPKVCDNCGAPFEAKRDSARFCSDSCRAIEWKANGGEGGGERVLEHPLQLVRDQAALDKHTRDLNGLIRQAIVDTIKTTGECHADDLIDLYPEDEVDRCRELATRQFASLRSGKTPLIAERERRASTIPARKKAKSGVYGFTTYGRETLVGPGSGSPGGVPAAWSGEDHIGQAEGKSDQGRPPSASSAADVDLPASLFDRESECSAYGTWEDAA